jgi:prepilin-type N-terminal cleavage/methylation domain-containing protein/prepilin-type processing-associated H-X9-DG protein
MRQLNRKAFTLVELLVVIAIIGTLVGLLLPAVQASREASRRNVCSTNLVQLAKAMQMYEDANGKFPGYINGLGIPNGQATRGPWVVYMFPHLEQRALWERWSQGMYNQFQYVETLVCPSNPTTNTEDGPLSYVANCGEWVDEDSNGEAKEVAANGVFFNHSRYADHPKNMMGYMALDGFDDEEDPEADAPLTNMSLAYIQSRGDGSNSTMLLSESIRTVRYGYRGDSEPDMPPDEYDATKDAKYHFGFTWAQPQLTIGDRRVSEWELLRVNGMDETSDYGGVSGISQSDGFPSSHHSGGVNVAWVDSRVTFLNENVDQLVYCQLMTTNHKSSTLLDPSGEIPEKNLPQPTDDKY